MKGIYEPLDQKDNEAIAVHSVLRDDSELRP
jgi:hypothetical protein